MTSRPTGIELFVCEDITFRQQTGIAKYGCTVAQNPLGETQWLQHAYEEALDLAVYLKRLIVLKCASTNKAEGWPFLFSSHGRKRAQINKIIAKKSLASLPSTSQSKKKA